MIKINKVVFTVLFVPMLLMGILLSVAHMWAASAEVAQAAELAPSAALTDLRITEIMYHPLTDTTYSSNEYEFIELTNIGTSSQDISGVSFGNGITYTFAAGTTIGPNSSLAVAKNPTAFQARYGFAPHNSSVYLGQLRNEGETISLLDAGGTELLTVKYDNDEPLLTAAEGYGFSLVSTDPAVTPSVRGDWRTSSALHGSPGQLTTAPNRPLVVVNEVLAHTDLPQKDFIELYNDSGAAVDISNWIITDNLSDLTRFTIPAGTTIPANGYLTLNQDELGFAFNSEGDVAYLFAVDGQGELTGYAHGFSFGPSPNGISLGRCTIAESGAADDEEFVLQNVETIGAENSPPQVGPVIISEIMYNGEGADALQEFIELTNISSNPVPLYDPASPANAWRIRSVGPYTLPTGTSIPGNGTILIVRSNPATFRSTYNIPNTIAVFGPYSGALNNDGERISLEKPDEQNISGTVPYYEVDGVRYNDALPWPLSADGLGKSLERVVVGDYADSVLNWTESAIAGGTPGRLSTAQQNAVGNPNTSIFLPIISNGQNIVAAQRISATSLMPQNVPCLNN